MKLTKFEKSSIELKVKGCNLEKALNFLCSKNIKFLEVKKTDLKNANLKVRPQDYDYIKKYLNERKIEIEEEKNHGPYKIMSFLLNRWGFLVGCFVCVFLFIFMSNFLLNIQIYGTENINNNEIVKVLKQNNINPFKTLNSISTKQVEEVIVENFDDVSLVSVIKKGSTLIINIKEKLKNEEFENLNNLNALVASEDGIIKDINLIQGTLNVKIGDIVKKGDTLVFPYTTDSSGKQIPITPKAEIVAEVWITGKSSHSESEIKTTRTGNYVEFRETSICGIPIFSGGEQNIFNEYEVEIRENYLSDHILPIKYKETFYFETKCDILNVDFETVKDKKIEEAKNDALSKIDDGLNIVNESYNISNNLGNYIITYSLTADKNIAK